MDRRDFMKAAGLAGLSLTVPLGGKKAHAQDMGPYDGTFFVLVNAGGGWDPTSLCDPKGAVNAEDTDPMNHYLRDDIGTAGNIRYAPMADNQAFFDKHYSRLMVVNGVDTATNGHDSGSRHTWSGRLAEGFPSLGALMAASLAPVKPLKVPSSSPGSFTARKQSTRPGTPASRPTIAGLSGAALKSPVMTKGSSCARARIRSARSAVLRSRDGCDRWSRWTLKT